MDHPHRHSDWQQRIQKLDTVQQTALTEFLGEALRDLRAFLTAFPQGDLQARLEAIDADYQLLCSFMLKGYRDDRREELHRQLAERTYRLIRDTMISYRVANDPQWEPLGRTAQTVSLEPDVIRQHLEGFVYDVALSSLEAEAARTEKLRTLYLNHHTYMQQLFAALLTSHLWSPGLGQQMTQLLLSPSVDTADVQVLVSAVMLSCFVSHDAERMACLISLYEQAHDEAVRQRALVGWVMCSHLMDEWPMGGMADRVRGLLGRREVCEEVYSLQIQMIYCINARRDNDKIQRDIMPGLMRNQQMTLLQSGILPQEGEEALREMLHPDEAEQKMEEMERSMQRMMDMRNQGVDIYFSGFAQMKRFSFFYTLANWFMPYSEHHPQLQHLPADFLHSRFIATILRGGMFCESDKYSFVLASSSVVHQLPAEMMEALNSGTGMPDMAQLNDEQRAEPQYVRRMYLQDLYRFFTLSDYGKLFRNPFGHPHELVLATRPYMEAMPREVNRLGMFLYKQKMHDMLADLMDHYREGEGREYYLLSALSSMAEGYYSIAADDFAMMLQLDEHDEEALSGYAQASFRAHDYEEAVQSYEKLYLAHSDNRLLAINYATSLIYCERAEEAARILYRLDYEHPADTEVKRVMAWLHLWEKRLGEAADLYDQIVKQPDAHATDHLNAAYCHWFVGNTQQAVMLMVRSLRLNRNSMQQPADVYTLFVDDEALFEKYAVGTTEQKIMAELVFTEYKRVKAD